MLVCSSSLFRIGLVTAGVYLGLMVELKEYRLDSAWLLVVREAVLLLAWRLMDRLMLGLGG